jgi:hypothetical protein
VAVRHSDTQNGRVESVRLKQLSVFRYLRQPHWRDHPKKVAWWRIAVRFTAARMSTIKLLIEDYLAANEQYQLETSEDERRPFNPHSAPSTVTLKILSKSSKRLPDLNYRLICWISRFTISPKNLIALIPNYWDKLLLSWRSLTRVWHFIILSNR